MTTVALSNEPPNQPRKFDVVQFLEKYGVLLFLILLCAGFALHSPMFLSVRNITNILTEVSIYGIVAVGMTCVILTGGVDLAVGSVLAFAALVGAWVVTGIGMPNLGGMGFLLALLIACAVGTLTGYVHGKVITLFSVPPFIVTLGGMTIWRGATLVMNDGAPVAGFDAGYRWWGRGDVLGIPVPVLVLFAVAAACYVVLRYTRFGRQIYAVGGNPEAARLSGINVNRVLVSVYVIVGFLAGLAGFLLSARLGSAEAIAGTSYELRIIASVVIGGTSLFGGIGGVGGTVIGALLIGVLLNGLVMMNVSPYYQQIVMGVIIVLAVAFDTYAKMRRGKR
ncbi:ABC transporter permease [Azospirillum thermophilum]|uniref:Sugar ABC transporter permease n=1 Tax=Azospirillum thermophilum TaxID=2202148 RepID=A0A2S2CZ76_9PROT|nr:ABC transporter permease [Azospirillum thermophilum]AWK89833.1 sugar ABC transporter permease [Azospirillum thermophilum]